MAFDQGRYAQVQEFGLSHGAQDADSPKAGGLCVMQALNFCTHNGSRMTGLTSRNVIADRHSQVPGELRGALIVMNDNGDDEDRKWLLELLPKIAEVLPNVNKAMAGIPWPHLLGIHVNGSHDLNAISKALAQTLGVEEQKRKARVITRPMFQYNQTFTIDEAAESVKVGKAFSSEDFQAWFEKNVKLTLSENPGKYLSYDPLKTKNPIKPQVKKVLEQEEALCPA